MILLSKAQSVPWTPEWRKTEPSPPRYMLRPGDLMERQALEAELAGEYRAGVVYPFERLTALRDGVMALSQDAVARDHVVSLIDAQMSGQAIDGAEAALIEAAHDAMMEHWKPYRSLIAQSNRRNQFLPVLAFQRFCTGWEGATDRDGAEVPYSRDMMGMVTEDAAARLPGVEMQQAGHVAYRMLYARGQEKNSPPPSPSGDERKISRSGSRSRAGGKSKAKAGTKTPA